MEKITNPDDVFLKRPQDKEPPLTEEELKGFGKVSPLQPIYDWCKKIKVFPYVEISRGPEAPGGKSIFVGIKGTF